MNNYFFWWDKEQAKLRNRQLRHQREKLAKSKGTHTQEQWLDLVKEFGGRCVRCGLVKPVERDHITPLYFCNESATDGIENIQPLCSSCNSSKGNSTFNYVRHRRAVGFFAAGTAVPA